MFVLNTRLVLMYRSCWNCNKKKKNFFILSCPGNIFSTFTAAARAFDVFTFYNGGCVDARAAVGTTTAAANPAAYMATTAARRPTSRSATIVVVVVVVSAAAAEALMCSMNRW